MENRILELIVRGIIGHIDVVWHLSLSCKNTPILVKLFNQIHMKLKSYFYMNFTIQNLLYNENN